MALRDYLIANGYNYDGTTEGNKVGKSMTSTSDWGFDAAEGTAGNDLKSNNRSGFSAVPAGSRWNDGSFHAIGISQYWWSITPHEKPTHAYMSSIHSRFAKYGDNNHQKRSGFSIRLIWLATVSM